MDDTQIFSWQAALHQCNSVCNVLTGLPGSHLGGPVCQSINPNPNPNLGEPETAAAAHAGQKVGGPV